MSSGKNVVVIGTQWGDEGKGKIVDLLMSDKVAAVVRFQGGHNAGHTLVIDGEKTAQNPDLYDSVNLGHLKKLKAKKMMEKYIIYTHNQLELMVAKGNPKNIKGPHDLNRDDLVQSHPNPLTEGIFKFYGSQMLKDLGIYEKVTTNNSKKNITKIIPRICSKVILKNIPSVFNSLLIPIIVISALILCINRYTKDHL